MCTAVLCSNRRGRMGNIRRWAGPLSNNWLRGQLDLQHKILARMTSLGMMPILPGFGGIVPEALIRIYPQLNYSRVESWAGFPDNLSSSFLLEPTENLYVTLGQEFITEMKREFGDVTHFYNADSFNEQRPNTSAQTFIKNVADATFKGMVAADPDAIWVMQGWLFYYDADFWTPELTKSLLTEAPLGRMIVLDLDADAFPIWPSTQSFYGQPFIWCMLHNYGGVQGLYGRISHINKDPMEARNASGSTMIGVGLTMEGINQNEVMYELMNEMSWRTQPVAIDEWMANFTGRRYGDSNDDAHLTYQILGKKVLDHPTTWANQGRYIVTRRPHFNYPEPMWYDPKDVFESFSHLLRAATVLAKTDMLLYDIVDLSRQSLQIVFHSTYERFQAAFEQANVTSVG
ncbi:hypothetical protein RvY_16572-2 [Ramazzottius varieornatus]|uniref:Alpha-N-acetylglucosaminidase tim-barrel domain-containing protein n=1 Tax=Ramazzottius varieornatus TaxID=947166 RepID=A0A1D1VZQ9_RAMVA|nr:hypothetical protein RvY_16572-2 [Ramazzottius varieornatus]